MTIMMINTNCNRYNKEYDNKIGNEDNVDQVVERVRGDDHGTRGIGYGYGCVVVVVVVIVAVVVVVHSYNWYCWPFLFKVHLKLLFVAGIYC